MTENPVTGYNISPKRVRISEPSTTGKKKALVKTPKAIALSCVTGHASSLHPQVAKIIQQFGEKQIDIYSKLQHKQTQLNRMNTDHDFIPRSARINFEFYVRPEVKNTAEFKEIQDDTTRIIDGFQRGLKEQIVRALNLDINYLHTDLNNIVCDTIYHTTKSFHLLYNPSLPNPSVTKTVAHLINGYGDALLKHCTLNKDTFKQWYNNQFSDSSILTLSQNNRVTNSSDPRNPYANLSQVNQDNSTSLPSHLGDAIHFVDKLRATLETILCTTLDNFNNQVKSNKVASQLEAYSTEILCEKATAATAERMDITKSVTPEEMQELVQKSTAAAVSNLTREIQSLRDKLTNPNNTAHRRSSSTSTSHKSSKPKNSTPRGRPGASSKKKYTNTNGRYSRQSRSPSPLPNHRNNRHNNRNGPGGPSNATGNNSRSRKNSNNNRSTQKRRPRSRSRPNRK